ncbi:MAG: nuclear transport factor 2 family protein [Pseudomonadota bacterium]
MQLILSALVAAALGLSSAASADPLDDASEVAALDVAYQAAVKANDAETMDRILHDQFTLVLGSGKAYSKADLIQSARDKSAVYEQQDEEPGSQTVRVAGDAAVVTAKLWLKGVSGGAPFERKLWFSDTYVRTKDGWKYFFGQASLPLPREEQ